MTARYTHALVRRVGENFCDGVTAAEMGPPDLPTARSQHDAYCDALRAAGVAVTVLDADPRYPDGVFVEDAAVVAGGIAVIARPGAAARDGEQHAVEQALAPHLSIERIQPPGTLDGGDVLRVGDRFFIGLSARTNGRGAQQLIDILQAHGYQALTAAVEGILHLKTGVTALDDRTLLAAGTIADQPAFEGFDVIRTPADETNAANCLRINDLIILPQDNPQTAELIRRAGHRVVELGMSEFRKMDGGLTCLSILW